MATIVEKKPGVFFARVFVAGAPDEPRRQVGKTFRGTKKAVRQQVAAWEAEVLGRAPIGITATVADLLTKWQEAKAHVWEPTTIRDHAGRCKRIAADIGTVRLLDLDAMRVDEWLAQMRRRGVGEGAIRGRVTTLKAACSWGVSRRMLNRNPVADASPKVRNGSRAV